MTFMFKRFVPVLRKGKQVKGQQAYSVYDVLYNEWFSDDLLTEQEAKLECESLERVASVIYEKEGTT